MIIFNKLDNYFVVSDDSQTFLGFEMTANFRDTSSPLISTERGSIAELHIDQNARKTWLIPLVLQKCQKP